MKSVMALKEAFIGTGRRKTSTARVFLRPGKGEISINGRTLTDMFPRKTAQIAINQPFDETETSGKFDTFITVCGGGISAQADAIQLGISRALLKFDEKLRAKLRKASLLTRDARKVERKKCGKSGARRSKQFSKR